MPSVRILVHQIGQLGDTIVSVPALRAIRSHFGPSAWIGLLHDTAEKLVTAQMVLQDSRLVDQFIPYEPEKTIVGKLRTMSSLWLRLRRQHFDAVVSVLPSDRPRWALLRDRIFYRACGISRLIGFRRFRESEIHPRTWAGRPARMRNEAVIRLQRLLSDGVGVADQDYLQLPLLSVSRECRTMVDGWLQHRRKFPTRPLIAVCPGCKKPGNAWPPERFLEVARRLVGLHAVELVILGGSAERSLADGLTADLKGHAIHAAGCFSVAESAALLSRCSLSIGLDTGTTHLAAAVGVPCVVLQSASSFPGNWDPLGENHSVLRAAVPCEGCLRQKCSTEGHPCMRGLTVEIVWEAIGAAISQLGCGQLSAVSAGRE
jgi:ADP-heptose:LPS heptosyltransferase